MLCGRVKGALNKRALSLYASLRGAPVNASLQLSDIIGGSREYTSYLQYFSPPIVTHFDPTIVSSRFVSPQRTLSGGAAPIGWPSPLTKSFVPPVVINLSPLCLPFWSN